MPAAAPTLTLKKPVERVVAHGHPWIYRDALEPHEIAPGKIATVLDRQGRFLARGIVERGPIGVRVFVRSDVPLDDALIARRLEDAIALRRAHWPADTTAVRLVHGEGDLLPGVVVDVYGAVAVLRLDGQAIERFRGALVATLAQMLPELGVETLLERSGRGDTRRVQALWGALPDGLVEVREHGMRMPVDLIAGQKTGLFLDHRDARLRVRSLASGARVVNLFGYTGGFSMAAGLGGAAHVDTVDVASGAIALAREGWARNGLDASAHDAHTVDVEKFLNAAKQQGTSWELVIADPPSFAPNEAAKRGALKAYRALHTACLSRVTDGGLYLGASCSSHVHREDFDATIREAAHAAKVSVQVLERSGAGFDHPVPVGFPEGAYLKSTLCRVLRLR